jgi:membrane protein YdbS with pleckstrin-like domain
MGRRAFIQNDRTVTRFSNQESEEIMTANRKIVIISLAVVLLIAVLLQSWNVDNLGNNRWLENGIDIVLSITVILAVSTTPKNSN